MATYYKPQSPIQSGEDFIYPITTADQIMKSDKSRRLEQAGLIVADNSTSLGGVAAKDYALKTDTAPDSSKLGGVAASDYALKTDTAPDSAKLGGKAPEYYLQPMNLLDNSDFRNPVNQRGQTSYDAIGYNIDRWRTYSTILVSITSNGIACDATTTAGNFNQLIAMLPNGIYTFAAKVNGIVYSRIFEIVNGSVTTLDSSNANFPGNGYLGVSVNSSGVINVFISNAVGHVNTAEWAALYEGSYTADTLPPYVPKGYAAELTECQRYCLAIDYNSENFIAGLASSTNTTTVNTYFPLPVPMRITPSLSSTDGSTWVIDMDGTRYVPTEVAIWFMSINATLGMKFTCSSGLTSRKTGVVSYNSATKLILSCDL